MGHSTHPARRVEHTEVHGITAEIFVDPSQGVAAGHGDQEGRLGGQVGGGPPDGRRREA